MDTNTKALQAAVTEMTRDISGDVVGIAIGLYLPAELAREIRGEGGWRFECDLTTSSATYVFLDCDEAQLDQVNEALRGNSFPWVRSGLSYRAAPSGHQYRWYLRLDGEAPEATLRPIFENILGPSLPPSIAAQVLEDWMIQFDEENRNLRRLAEISALDAARVAELDRENRALRDQLSAIQGRAEELERLAKTATRDRRTAQRRELREVLQVLLPEVDFLRDSLDVITRELESFGPVLRELRSIASAAADHKAERVEGVSHWKERRFHTGQKHDGRLYFRKDDGSWVVLVSFKDSQRQDIEYLKTR
jgi:hypothetical protein